MGMVSDKKGTIMNKKGRRIFSKDSPKATRISESPTSCETTIMAQMIIKDVKKFGSNSLIK
jgi:hypothetical protein